MYLFDIPKIIKTTNIKNLKQNIFFTNITSDSKLTNKKTIFIFDSGSKMKKKYIKESIGNNTPAIITNKYFDFIKITQIVVKDINDTKEKLLHKIHKHLPKNNIAITGTNGKTSVVWYISKILQYCNYKNKTLGTLGYYKNGKKISNSSLTTPAIEKIFSFASEKKKSNYTFVFEASSHALDQNRIGNLPINIAALTNISNDHLDYHKTFIKYKNSKLKLFNKHLEANGVAILNSRIKNIRSLINFLKHKNKKIIFYGKKDIFFTMKDNKFKINIFNKKYNINELKLNSEIEIQNLECAISCCVAIGIKNISIINAIKNITNPPGRIQKINYKKKKSTIIVDYAHTPDALKNILLSQIKNNQKPNLVFGCGGNRDISKRKLMAQVARKYSKNIYVTDDNPRYEDPSQIRKQILKYCPRGIEIANRKNAIKFALKKLCKNEILIIAGKGHEKFQIYKNKINKISDQQIVKEIISK